MIGNVKLGVEVLSATNLIAKDGEGTSSAFVELHFDGQRHRTTIKEKDLNPQWNERFSFTVSDPANLPNLTLDAYVYHDIKPSHSRSLLGRVRLHSHAFVAQQDAVTLSYPLEKRNIISRAKGELSLRVYLLDDHLFHNVQPSIPFVTEPVVPTPAPVPVAEPAPEAPRKGHNHRDTHQFYSLPNQHSAQEPPPRVVINHDEAKPVPPPVMRVYNNGVGVGAGGIPFVQTMPSSSGEFSLKETSPLLGGGQVVGGRVIRGTEKPMSTYDLVEEMRYLFVRVVKARDLPAMDVTGSCDPFVEVKLGNYKATTRHFEKNSKPEWNEVFAFSRERLQSSVVEVVVKDKDMIKDDFIGRLRLDINEIPVRVPPDSPLAPEWYRLEKKDGEKLDKGELMLAVWIGTQADESFPEAWHSDAIPKKDGFHVSNIRSKVYHSPRLWYLRLQIIEAQDLYVKDKTRYPEVYVKAQLGNQTIKTRFMQSRNFSPVWNEEHMFVAAEPFEDHLVLTIEDRVGPNKDETIGKCSIPLATIEKRADDRLFNAKWYNLERPGIIDPEVLKKDKFATRLHIRVCFDGGYHVLDESTHYSSDLRPTAKQLWKQSIGVLELGILNAQTLHPVKTREGKGVSDTFCVAKYGQKWVRTRTIIDDPCPKWNEQYTWEVYDACTVLTVGVFDNGHIGGEDKSNGHKDLKVGKVRIRLSTLEAGRVYTHSYPLLVLHSSGVKKMGEIHLAIRFSCTSTLNMMCTYARPLLPKMHYVRPLSIHQVDTLRHHAVSIVGARLGRAEPPLRKEVVEYMSDVDSHMWSMRRSKANFFRLMGVFSGLMAVAKWFGEVCAWTNPVTTVLVHLLFVILVCFPELIFPTAFLYMFLIGLWNYRYRARHPPHMDTRLSHAEAVHPDELDEEFDTFPTSRSAELVRMRYDRLRSVAGRIQTVVGDVATQGERLHSLLSWRDPRATTIFLAFCFCAAMVLYVTPFQVVLVALGFYLMRHPRFRYRLPSTPLNFFRRLPAKTDSLL
ncbi:FT-interacting protein 7-like [Nymphaea colorata]|uniref:C2 domain-containing protein n=1 Tax=Nymphaea colorata TaxID=210225 RepID=A0A5K1CL43_9MAGN|nr:FT-interacting protein 7-like [Nymphaea colorata]XP_049933639.1 FT-interacting protein 7-like [Nymphaea colorata]